MDPTATTPITAALIIAAPTTLAPSKVLAGVLGGGAELKAAVKQLRTYFMKQLNVEQANDVQSWATELCKHNKCYSDCNAKFETAGIGANKVEQQNTSKV